AAMDVVMAQLKRRGLLFLDSRTARGTLAASTARMMGVTTLERDVFLDNVVTPEAIRAQLGKTEDAARSKGYAIAIGHPHTATVNALGLWAAGLEARGFKLVPLSTLTLLGPSTKHVVLLPLREG
ncbi:MAG: divergent polysaccharide deacetylase family protein, partial [Alphaproteobacteria bacterium]